MEEVKKSKAMFVSKVLLIVTVVVLYAMEAAIFIPLWGIMHQLPWPNFNFWVIGILLGIALILGLAALIFAIIGTVKQDDPYTKITLILKVVLVPFFALNLYAWLCLVSGMLNPFLMMGIPAIICLGICLTYVYMMMTSLPDIIYMIAFSIRRKKKPNAFMVAGIILEFFFVLDILGSIFIHKAYNDIQKEMRSMITRDMLGT
ncbi:MAG: hypothetical protein J5777_06955 [Clostridiales bacterium]|nr:hypothetical protein [Clostridiales bacterium]